MKRRYPLYNVVLGVFLIVILIVSLLISFSIYNHKKDLILSAIDEKIKLAETIKETVALPSWLYRMSVLGDLEKGLIYGLSRFRDVSFIRIIRADGEVYQSTFEEEIGTKINDSDINEVVQSGKYLVKDQTFSDEKIKALLYPGYENQVIWIGFSLASTQSLIREALWRYLFVAFAILTLFGLAAVIIIRNIVDPIKKITLSCRDVQRGSLDIKLKTNNRTEVGELAEAFNEMIKDIRDSHDKLEEAKEILEIRVGARTQELQDLTESLEGQVKERTKDIQDKLKQLESFNRLVVDRELKMSELKKEIKGLKQELERRSLP
ncbi:HAMP domain-containing protein [Candidatus Parcubacteria bacterium]|nr:HAMP domain-containing protein [Patescibacteria group bacterium]MBU4466813.1 HAMP domain-containing protein [Patescibacteria group bacterium]MCG2688116.1 HAMP domain-containing protein [Candidatus Parcubacteria bacterium]